MPDMVSSLMEPLTHSVSRDMTRIQGVMEAVTEKMIALSPPTSVREIQHEDTWR
jgi:hypothetical protein